MVYSTRRFVVCRSVCYFVLVFFSPFSIAITSLGEERANLSAFRTFVRFVLVWICLDLSVSSSSGVWEWLPNQRSTVLKTIDGRVANYFKHCRNIMKQVSISVWKALRIPRPFDAVSGRLVQAWIASPSFVTGHVNSITLLYNTSFIALRSTINHRS